MSTTRLPFCEFLREQGMLTQAQVDETLALQHTCGSRVGDILLSKGWITAFEFSTAIAKHLGLPFVNLMEQPVDPSLFSSDILDDCCQRLVLPWRRENGVLLVAMADPCAEVEEWITQTFKGPIRLVCTAKFDIVWSIQNLANQELTYRAINALSDKTPGFSARKVVTFGQVSVLFGLLSIMLAGFALQPENTLLFINCMISIILLATFGFKFLLSLIGSRQRIDIHVIEEEVAALRDDDLPIYTVLVPMYKEPDVLPILTNALRRLNYPISKLDVKLVLESDDYETINAAKELALESFFEIIKVPPSQPKTKPKACNYAMRFARGEFLTIYDAEDKPESNQLKQVIAAFRKASPDVVCMQCCLNYYNAAENWLTRMFTLEYTLWFDFYLPALEILHIPIPLGGTSNHFRLSVLRDLEAWDPFNVTEDADLGVRITQQGHRVGVVNSTTYEEANVSIPNWINQRSRWLKGYMQTYLVHMRDPVHLYRSTGHKGFWGFQFFIGGNFFCALVAPFLWACYFVWLFTGTNAFDHFFPPLLGYISVFNLLVGNGFFIYLTLVAGFKRNYFKLVPMALTVPFYWLLQSVAAYKALWQLITKPFYWEKTVHGLSKQTANERKAALET